MAYVTQADIEGRIPPQFLLQALDDDGDGVADAWEAVAADTDSAIDGILGTRFSVPFTGTLPTVVTEAAKAYACHACYRRRSVPDAQNPWQNAYDIYFHPVNGLLLRIAAGKAPLSPGVERAKPSGGAVVEAAPTFSTGGRRAV